MPDSSTKTINWPSRWAFFKTGPSASFPAAHGILIPFDRPLLEPLRAKAQRAQDAPDLSLAKAYPVHALDDSSHTLPGAPARAPLAGHQCHLHRAAASMCARFAAPHPTAKATSAQPLPASSIRPAFNRFFTGSLNRFCGTPIFSSIATGDITLETFNGCHDLRKCH